MKIIRIITLFFILGVALTSVFAKNGKSVLAIKVDGAINPVTAEFIEKNIDKVNNSQSYEAIVIELDTPGGLDTSMRTIIKSINGSNIPVIVYVSPSGARAASAGVFITMAAHIGAMAPGTNMGAAHPVSMSGKMDKTMEKKVTNDSVAYIKSIAQKRGRNVEWAEDAVRKSVSVTDEEALKLNVIDYRAESMGELLNKIDGVIVDINGKKVTVNTKGVHVEHQEMGTRLTLLKHISDPNVAYILLMLGFYGILFELYSPGAIFPGVIGAISLIIGLYSLQTLPVNYAGLLLIALSIVLFILEVKIMSYGLLSIGGIISMAVGSLMLFESDLPFLRVSISMIISVVGVTALFFFLMLYLAIRDYKSKPTTGQEGLTGMTGVAKTDLAPVGMVFVHGELWNGESSDSDEFIPGGTEVIVDKVIGMKVKVSKKRNDHTKA